MSIKEQLLLCHHSCVVTVTFDTWSISLCIPPLTYTHTLQCGVLLGGLLLLVSATLTIWSCNMVLRAAHLKGKQSFESLGQLVHPISVIM